MSSLVTYSEEFLEGLRIVNILTGFVACFVLYFFLARPRWSVWNVPTRLGWMSLFMLCFTGTYSTFEVLYLETTLRVPMITVALLWAILAAAWPRDDHCNCCNWVKRLVKVVKRES